MEKWFGKIAVVTGASAGMGAAIVEALARNGVHTVGLARRKDRVEAIAARNKDARGKIYALECDITSETSISKAFDWIERTLGGVDILVNNAGLMRKALFFDLDRPDEDYRTTIETNLTGLAIVTRRAFKTMKDRPAGYIININSIGGQVSCSQEATIYGCNVYQPTKHAVTQLSAVMKFELAEAKKNIRVTSISPGAVKTDFDLAANQQKEPSSEPRIWDFIPYLEPEDIADAVVHVLSTKPSVNISELTIETAETLPNLNKI